ncbi:MAG: FAD-dependent monooxygenase [Reyranella sp.]|nr:FAD-dependent monooxygenase [Reyranella sp.]MBL6650474.1 FAD-dependent monooxygenase [Reyranella sp.]
MASVLISGAGPIGLTMANELARFGIAVRVVDKMAERTDKSKALVLWSRTLELLNHAGYVEPFLKAGMPAHGAQLSDGKHVVARVSMDRIDSIYNYALMIAQSETERVLEECLAKRGVKVERTVSMESFTQKGAGIEAILRKADGSSETVQADWLIGCDGAHSTTRHGLGFAFEGSTQDSDWYLADIHISGLEPADHLHIFWHRDGILAFFPITPGRWRVIADLGPATGSGHHPDPTLEEIQAMVAHRGGPDLKLSDPIWLAAFRINERKVKEYSRGHIFLAGDAAHIHSPAGGQGMNTGMQDVFNLAWKLNLVITGAAKPSLLDSYSIERSAVGEMVLRNAGRLTEAAIMRNPALQALRNTFVKFAMGFPQVAHVLVDTMSETNIAYPQSPLSVAGGHQAHSTKPGHRWPEPLAADTGKSRFVALGPADAVADLAAKFPKLVEVVPSKRADPRDLILVRPDGYVGFAGAASDRAGAEAYLRSLAA